MINSGHTIAVLSITYMPVNPSPVMIKKNPKKHFVKVSVVDIFYKNIFHLQ